MKSGRMKQGILREYSTVVDLLMRLVDAVSVLVGAVVAHQWVAPGSEMSSPFRGTVIAAFVLVFLMFPKLGFYRAWRGSSYFSEMRLVTTGLLMLYAALVTLIYVVDLGTSIQPSLMTVWFLMNWTLLVSFRVLLRMALRELRARGHNTRRVLLVGSGKLVRRVADLVRSESWVGLKVIGCIDSKYGFVPSSTGGVARSVDEILDGLAEYVADNAIDQVWLAFPMREEEEIKRVLHTLRHSTADIRMVPDIFDFFLLNHSMSEVAGLPVINLRATPLVGMNRIVKEVEDRLLGLLILMLISPLMVALAIGVKLSSPGPVLFKQKRHGWDGKPIEVWKFRSMKVHEEKAGHVTQASRNDSRITPLGAFLRRTSLDELPQFINVVQGTMSIVGPRPHAIEHNEQYKELVDRYMLRHKVKPGITGWAQINGYRGETDTLDKMQKRVEHDLYYIDNWSPWLDIKIIVLTLFKGFIHHNAY